MRIYNKILLVFVGIILVAFSVYQISLRVYIPGLSEWSKSLGSANQEWLQYTLVGALFVSGIVGAILFLLGLFKPITKNRLVLNGPLGKLEIPRAALEKSLRYKLVENFGLVAPEVEIQLLRNQRAKVKVRSEMNEDQNIEQLAKSVNQFVVEYLKSQLDVKVVKPVSQISPANRNRRVKVV